MTMVDELPTTSDQSPNGWEQGSGETDQHESQPDELVISWGDVAKTTGGNAKRRGLAAFDPNKTVRLFRFADEQKGTKNKRWELTADAFTDTDSKPRRVIVPPRYAEKIREKIEQLGERAEHLVIPVRIEVSSNGSIMLRDPSPPTPPATDGQPTTKRRGRPARKSAA